MTHTAIVISDTHNHHNNISVPWADFLIHCGDATGRGRPHEVASFLSWFEKQTHRYKIMIAGNHDFMFQDEEKLAKDMIADHPDIIYLQDKAVKIEGIKFYGSPWQPWFHDWAFNLERGVDIAVKWEDIPDDTEFLITHGPPKGILDETEEGDKPGCYDLLERVKDVKPKVHAFGHIHEGYGVQREDDILFVNASTCTRQYAPLNKPVLLQRDEKGEWTVESAS